MGNLAVYFHISAYFLLEEIFMPDILNRLSPHNLDLKAQIAGEFYDNPFHEIGEQDVAARHGLAGLQDALVDLCRSGILGRRRDAFVFAPRAEDYTNIVDWCTSYREKNAILRQRVVERETLGRLQEQLALSQEKVQAILEIVPAGVFFLDRFGHFLTCNTLGASLLGISKDSVGVDLCALLGLELTEVFQKSVALELDGPPPLAVLAQPFASSASDAGVVVSVLDISMRRKLEAEAESLREEFFSMIRHELRKPLMTIERGLAQMDDGPAAGLARAAAAHMGEMVDDMLLLARLEQDPMAVSLEGNISLQFLLAGSDLAFRAKAEEASVALAVVIPDEDVVFCGDERRLAQVVGNLLDNAIKFTPAGGTVTLLGASDADSITIEVLDTGVGIPEEQRERVFGKFYQVDSIHRQQGLGLGLAICSKIVAAHQGKLEIDNASENGTRIVVTLPGKGI